MQKHYIDIVGKWAFILAYDVSLYDLDDIASWLDALGCSRREIRKACRVALATNSGFTFSNPELRMSLVCVSDASSREQWWDTLVHELDHLQAAICQYYDVDLGTEEAAYLQGYLMREVITLVGSPS